MEGRIYTQLTAAGTWLWAPRLLWPNCCLLSRWLTPVALRLPERGSAINMGWRWRELSFPTHLPLQELTTRILTVSLTPGAKFRRWRVHPLHAVRG